LAGFTLVELLIVMAVLGVLAVVVLIAINPVQQLARTRDTGRSSTVAQLGHAIEAFAAARNGIYPTDQGAAAVCTGATSPINTDDAWIGDCLVATGEVQVLPSTVGRPTGGGAVCDTAASATENDWCYDGNSTSAVIFTRAEANANIAQCTSPALAYFVYSTAAGRGGLWCGTAAALVPPLTTGFVQ